MTPMVSEMVSGLAERRDYEYERPGKSNLFVSVAPLTGKRRVRLTERRTALDFAQAKSWTWTIRRQTVSCWCATP